MNEDKITEILEGHNISEDKIAQIVDQFEEQFGQKKPDGIISDDFLEGQIEKEKDPLKKASLIAKRISKSFE